MSDNAKISIPVKRYETLGLILPGFVTLGAAFVLLLAVAQSKHSSFLGDEIGRAVISIAGLLTQGHKNIAQLVLLLLAAVLISIFVGHMVEAMAKWLYETTGFDRIYGLPYQDALGLHVVNRGHLLTSDGDDNKGAQLSNSKMPDQIESVRQWFDEKNYPMSETSTNASAVRKLPDKAREEFVGRVRKSLSNLVFHKAGLMAGMSALMLVPTALLLTSICSEKVTLHFGAPPVATYFVEVTRVFFSRTAWIFIGCSLVFAVISFARHVRKGRHERRMKILRFHRWACFAYHVLAWRQEQCAMFAFRLSGIDPHVSSHSREDVINAYKHFFNGAASKAGGVFGEFEPNFYRNSEPYWFAYWYLQRNSPVIADKINRAVNHTAFSRNLAGAWLLSVPMFCVAAYIPDAPATWVLLFFAAAYPLVALFLWARFIYFYVFTTKTVFRCLYVEYLSETRQRNTHAGHDGDPGAEFGV